MKVFIVGIGMGNPDTLTVGAKKAIESCGLLIGAQRLLEQFEHVNAQRVALIRSDEIVQAIQASSAERVAVLMSGDTGFFSGTAIMTKKLAGLDVEVLPGISSLSYFCAKLHIPWQDANIVSAHGRTCNFAGEVQSHGKTFALTGGKAKVEDLCLELAEHGLKDVVVHAGEHLSYENERIVNGTAEELAKMQFDDLAVMLVVNDCPIERAYAAPALDDEAFVRGKAPMTKEEVRALCISKLRIRPDAVVWDVGAGTGSVSVEAAFAACKGRVFAIEKDEEAVGLIEQNKEHFKLSNLEIVKGAAPQALADLEAPDCVFIGGSCGNMKEIMACALDANPSSRIVATGITLETISAVLHSFAALNLSNSEIVQVSVARSREVGSYHMMTGQNPIFIASANGPGE